MLYAALKEAPQDEPVDGIAARVVERELGAKRQIFGIGHHLHKPIDPRTPVLFAIAEKHGFRGRYVALMEAIAAAAQSHTGKLMPVNATGALGALCCELGLDWRLCRGLAVIGRAMGLVGHIAEELRSPIARQIWMRTEEEITRAVATADAGTDP
jgi:citrate synthase